MTTVGAFVSGTSGQFRYAASHRRTGNSARHAPVGARIRVVMEDRGAAIPAGEDMVEPAKGIASWLAGHGGERNGWSCNKGLLNKGALLEFLVYCASSLVLALPLRAGAVYVSNGTG